MPIRQCYGLRGGCRSALCSGGRSRQHATRIAGVSRHITMLELLDRLCRQGGAPGGYRTGTGAVDNRDRNGRWPDETTESADPGTYGPGRARAQARRERKNSGGILGEIPP